MVYSNIQFGIVCTTVRLHLVNHKKPKAQTTHEATKRERKNDEACAVAEKCNAP